MPGNSGLPRAWVAVKHYIVLPAGEAPLSLLVKLHLADGECVLLISGVVNSLFIRHPLPKTLIMSSIRRLSFHYSGV